MMIKKVPEDFIVEEIPDKVFSREKKEYIILMLEKRDEPLHKALELLQVKLRKKPREIGFAGTKDKCAITKQFLSVRNVSARDIEKLSFERIHLSVVGYSDEPLSLGELAGNKFTLTLRELTEKENKVISILPKEFSVPNRFGVQRFSENNVEVGLAIIKGDLKKAVEVIQQKEGDIERRVKKELLKNPHNYVSALLSIPKKILQLYIHAVQSDMFNNMLEKITKDQKVKEYTTLPLIGFGTQGIDPYLEKLMKEELEKKGISPRSFIIRNIPQLSSEGTERKTMMLVKRVEVKNLEKDVAVISFELDKGCYATTVIEFLKILSEYEAEPGYLW